MFIDFLFDRFREHQNEDAIVWRDSVYTYGWLLTAVNNWLERIESQGVTPGSVVALEADFSPSAIALMLALIEHQCIIVPLTILVGARKPEFRQVAQAQVIIDINQDDEVSFEKTSGQVDHVLLRRLRELEHPGLILFTSGSTGKSKAVVHDLVYLLNKYQIVRHSLRTIAFLQFDHIGGFDTLFYNLSNTSCLICVPNRSPETVCSAVEKYKAQVLPVSPTFINLLLLSEVYRRYDLSTLEIVTYGAEVMPENTLKSFYELFPHVQMMQKYGITEVGTLRSRSKSSDSLWVKIGGESYKTRIVDGLLEIKAESAMLGYLNAPSPFTEDGWFKTGDVVKVDGEYLHILGRKSEIINVGGEKVYPVEVESVLQLMEGVEDVVVSAEPSPITGQMVVVRAKLNTGESLNDFRKRMRAFCKDKLANYKIPQKVILADKVMYGERFKKMRRELEKNG
jgi:acyl-coenzyme A synthetase/AMP-(fatty) acid ligase